MKKILLSIIVLPLFVKSFGRSLPTKKEQYDFLQWFITTKQFTNVKPEPFIIDWGMFFGGDEKKMAKLKVTLKERDHFYPQVMINKKITMLDTIMIKVVQWKKPGPDTPSAKLSLPVFSKNKRLLFIHFEDDHTYNGNGYIYVGTEVYIKAKNGKWQLCKIQPFRTERLILQSEI